MSSVYTEFVTERKIEDLENYYIGQTPAPILSVKSSDTVDSVLRLLREKSISSVPVLDEKKSDTGNGTPYVAVVNATDLLIAFAFQPVFNTYDTDTKVSELKESTLSQVSEQQKKVLSYPVSDFAGLSLESKKLWTYTEKDSLSQVFDAFSAGVHRVLISHATRDKPYWTFVSQTDVLRYLKVQSYPRETKIHDIFLQSLSSLKLGTYSKDTKVFTLDAKETAIAGFRKMIQRNELSALPVVNADGRLVETLSASDFRHVNLDNFKDVLLPVADFLKKQRGIFQQILVTAQADEPLYSVVDKLLLTGVHRVWVVDREGKPTGVVSLTDIIKAFSVYAPSS
jgi:CBS domain-containing protein